MRVALTLAAILYMGAAALAAPTRADERWAGSTVSVKHSVGLGGLGFDPDFNPTLLQTLSIDPTWRFSDRLRLTGHLGVETELTDSDTSSYERQPLLEDATVTGAFLLRPGLTATLRLALPTSKEAIARRRLAALSPALTYTRTFTPGAWRLSPFATVRATWNWQLTTTLVYDGPTITGCDAERGDTCEAYDHAGQRSAAAGFAEIVGLSAALPRLDLTLTAQVWWVQAWLYDLAPVDGPDGLPVPSSPRNTDWRLSNVYLVAAEWQPLARWRFGAGLETQNPVETPDGGLYWPFFNRHTQLFVTATAVF
jgi:hypothetical protein